MQLEVGKYYKTRDGRKVFITTLCTDHEDRPYLTGITEAGSLYNWSLEGAWDVNDLDLVAEWPLDEEGEGEMTGSTDIDWAGIPLDELEMISEGYKGCKIRAVVLSSTRKGYGTIVVEYPTGELATFSNRELASLLCRKPKPFRHTRWVNVYCHTGPAYYLYTTREEAEKQERPGRVACIEIVIEGNEGDGL